MNGSAGCASDPLGGIDLSVTPRADTNLELLALKYSTSLVADQGIYERVVRDVGAIRLREPSVADIAYFPPDDGRGLLLSLEPEAYAQFRAGRYHAWDCLNERLGANDIQDVSEPYVSLTVRGIFRMKSLTDLYQQVDGIARAESNLGVGDGPTICLTPGETVWHYVFDHASGDCEAGCFEHSYLHFSTSEAGAVTALGVPSSQELETYASYEACR